MSTTESVVKSRSKAGTRGKFATPPVKIACLACRAARIRCDGKEPCTGCTNKRKECIFPTQSRRGGPRIHRNKRPLQNVENKTDQDSHEEHMADSQNFFEQVLPPMINPGSGLNNLDEMLLDTDTLFESIFSPGPIPAAPVNDSLPPVAPTVPQFSVVRRYTSSSDLLNGYYTWLHPFFPILPPPASLPVLDHPLQWFPESINDEGPLDASPLGLAISSILALIPFTEKDSPLQEDTIAVRRHHAQLLAKRTLESIESDSEIPDSAFSPANALLHEQNSLPRRPFHPHVPVELESIIALCMLSVYEYAQRGNLKKMRDRSGQALVAAMDLSLHCRPIEYDDFAESRRRTWWMTYVCVCQASIVSCTQPAISAHDPRFTTPYPMLAADPEAWPFYIRSQQAILSATLFVRQLNQAVEAKSDMNPVCDRMQELHGTLQSLITKTEAWPQVSAPILPTDQTEIVVASALKAMSKIKLNSAKIKVHRYCAFSDIPVFSERHCDLKKAMPISADASDAGSMVYSSCCTGALPIHGPNTPSAQPTPDNSLSPSSSFSGSSEGPIFAFPFTSHESSRICLKSALNIARAFESLPFPCPVTSAQERTTSYTPRTMPSFACCAMQSAYALLNLHHKAFVMVGNSTNDHLISNLLAQCESGLESVLAALDNYSMSFEALSGMRDQVRVAITCLSAPAW